MSRPLTNEERTLVEWMLINGGEQSRAYLKQLALATVVGGCPCGCASIDFSIDGNPRPIGPLELLADFLYGGKEDLAGAFVFAINGQLAGLEVYGLACDAPTTLPKIESLRPFEV